MREGRRSRTAEATALLRAAHRVLDDRPLVLDDPWAARLLPRHLGLWFLALPAPARRLENRLAARFAGPTRGRRIPFGSRRIRAQVVVRSRYCEDHLARSTGEGLSQYVILAAGLDSFGLRQRDPSGRLEVFEVDHPQTQRWKRGRLRQLGVQAPRSLTLVPCDFERRSPEEALADSTFDPQRPSFLSWLGVSYYLSGEALRETLRFLATLPAGSRMAMDFWCDEGMLGAPDRALLESIRLSVAGQGEPMLSFLTPGALREEAGHQGLRVVEELSAERAQRQYLAGRRDGLAMPGFARLALLRRT